MERSNSDFLFVDDEGYDSDLSDLGNDVHLSSDDEDPVVEVPAVDDELTLMDLAIKFAESYQNKREQQRLVTKALQFLKDGQKDEESPEGTALYNILTAKACRVDILDLVEKLITLGQSPLDPRTNNNQASTQTLFGYLLSRDCRLNYKVTHPDSIVELLIKYKAPLILNLNDLDPPPESDPIRTAIEMGFFSETLVVDWIKALQVRANELGVKPKEIIKLGFKTYTYVRDDGEEKITYEEEKENYLYFIDSDSNKVIITLDLFNLVHEICSSELPLPIVLEKNIIGDFKSLVFDLHNFIYEEDQIYENTNIGNFGEVCIHNETECFYSRQRDKKPSLRDVILRDLWAEHERRENLKSEASEKFVKSIINDILAGLPLSDAVATASMSSTTGAGAGAGSGGGGAGKSNEVLPATGITTAIRAADEGKKDEDEAEAESATATTTRTLILSSQHGNYRDRSKSGSRSTTAVVPSTSETGVAVKSSKSKCNCWKW